MKGILLLLFVISGYTSFAQKDTLGQDLDTLYGVASYYSPYFDSLKTATGEMYLHSKLTGASNFYKLNTWVRVTNLRNGRSVVVRINDRMARRMAGKGRVIDLSRSAAKILGFMKSGITKVRLIKVPKGTKK
jgi:rare lipoprotein A